MKILLMVFFIGFDGTNTFYKMAEFSSVAECKKIESQFHPTNPENEFKKVVKGCYSPDQLEEMLNAR